MSLKEEIATWNGKSADDIQTIYKRYCHVSHFPGNIIDLIKDPSCQKGATWLIKHHLDSSHCLEQEQSQALCNLLNQLEHWETRLHMLQCFEYIQIVETEKKTTEHFLRVCLSDDNKFVRAWAYNGFYLLSRQYPEYREEAFRFFDMAMKDEAASVKARIRNIMKNIPDEQS